MKNDQRIYRHQAEQYDALVSREDYQGNLLRTISQILPLGNLDVLELGAGTGRITRLIAPYVRSIVATDNSYPMLGIAGRSLSAMGVSNFNLAIADHRNLPARNHMADLVISGWSLCYLVSPGAASPYPNWREAVESALQEIERVLRPGGTIMVIETLGTGFETPHPPKHLKSYFRLLDQLGFASTWTRTDYQFNSLEEAKALTHFFFGDKMAQEVLDKGWVKLPECTGFWWKKFSQR